VSVETEHRRKVRAALLEAALDLFARYGYTTITHADVATAAGIGRTTFYEYFSSKDELLVQLVEQRLPELTDTLLADLPPDLSARDRLANIASRMVEFVATDHLGLLLHTEVPRLPDDVQHRIAAAHSGLARAFVDLCTEGAAEGTLRTVPPQLAARLVYETVMTAGRTLMEDRDPKQRVHEVADAAIDFLLHGLEAGPRT
jgi:AcrR family transcriptional regulator